MTGVREVGSFINCPDRITETNLLPASILVYDILEVFILLYLISLPRMVGCL